MKVIFDVAGALDAGCALGAPLAVALSERPPSRHDASGATKMRAIAGNLKANRILAMARSAASYHSASRTGNGWIAGDVAHAGRSDGSKIAWSGAAGPGYAGRQAP